ncbi:conserved hypothetical protein [Trichinella spiralis]|uniref:hypothetical protein n=1 Tax=Trichinella spiralis TaxID=6334 RepID=UPI0001EFD07A|nr:conserved hypothetical protein [Trichinella spiralis]
MYEVLTAFVVASGLAFVEVESIGIEFTTVGNDMNNMKTFSHWTQSGTVASLKGEGSDWCSQLRALFVSRFTAIAVVSGRQKSTVNCPLVDGLSEKQKIQIHSSCSAVEIAL